MTTDLDSAIARAQEAQARPRSLEELTLSERELDARHPDHSRLTQWWDEEPSPAALAHAKRRGVTVLRVRTCTARNGETGKREALWFYEWGERT